MKFNELELGVEYAVVPSWEYSSREKKDPNQVSRESVAKATLYHLDKYEYEVYRATTPNDSNFKSAPSGTRSVGYLVSATLNGQLIYWLARPQDIVAKYADLEGRWTKEEAERKIREQEEQLRRQKEEEERQRLREQRNRLESSTRETFTHILKDRAIKSLLDFDTRRVRVNDEYTEINVVSIDVQTFNILLEKVLEASEVNA